MTGCQKSSCCQTVLSSIFWRTSKMLVKACRSAFGYEHATMWLTPMANPWQVDESELKKVFQRAGCITSTAVMRGEGGRSRGFGFVNYASAADATRALAELDGHTDAGCVWQASCALSTAEVTAPRPSAVTMLHACPVAPMAYRASTRALHCNHGRTAQSALVTEVATAETQAARHLQH